jgi:hypothetical protein
MNKQLTVVFSIAILLTVTVVASVDLTQTADAAKAKGTTNQKYGSATKSQVCGDRLCSEIPPEERMNQKMQSSQGEMKMDMTNKEEMKQKHLQMLEDMKSMNKAEMIDSMKSSMSKHQDMMIEKMNQMDRQEILDHMDMMIGHMSKMDMKNMDMKNMDMKKTHQKMKSLYNEILNPNQVSYPNVVGFNDLHIGAIRHLAPHGDDSKLEVLVHHHCKVYDDMTAACLLFPTGMGDQDKPYGMEYIITSEQFEELPDDEKRYWHYHLTELPRAQAIFADLTDEELISLQPILDETYGKVFYFWDTDDKYPIGEPTVLVIQDLPE